MNDNIILQNALDSLESMIEEAGTYYDLQYARFGETTWMPALKKDIETAKKSWQDLKNLIDKDNI